MIRNIFDISNGEFSWIGIIGKLDKKIREVLEVSIVYVTDIVTYTMILHI